MRAGLVILWVVLLTWPGYSQEKCRWIFVDAPQVTLDSLSVIPSSIRLRDKLDREVIGTFLSADNRLILPAQAVGDSLWACYQVLPFSLHQKRFHRSLAVYDSNAVFKDKPPVRPPGTHAREELFATEGLQKSGSISRGVSMGNTQNAFVTSNLNLNLEGKLTDDLSIRAHITDQNIPFQPEGNTRQLQEFDNVYIQLFNDQFTLTGGDVVMKNKDSHFLKYYKNVQGALAERTVKTSDSLMHATSLGVSVAKGKFFSVILEVEDGVLGPYRIPPPQGQGFLIILANSERVFLDGKLLTRGFNQDYVIDYNQGEITLTNQVLITRFSRLRIDYEYSDRNYSRSITLANHYQKAGRLDFFVNAYSEKDNRNRPLLVDLSDEDKMLLQAAGDDPRMAVRPSADSVGFMANRIMYEKLDTLDAQSNLQGIYRYSTDPQRAVYQVRFTEVGEGNGDYVLSITTANGRVFEWVSPQNGQSQGRYAPVTELPAPTMRQMLNGGIGYGLNSHERVFAEWAVSRTDLNLFSELDNADNSGHALKVGWETAGRSLGKALKWSAGVDYEYNHRHFSPIDRFRYIEFDRDWNFDPAVSSLASAENILTVGMNLQKDLDNGIGWKTVRRQRSTEVDGWQHYGQGAVEWGKWQLRSDLFLMRSTQLVNEASWHRMELDISRKGRLWVPGVIFRQDQNQVRSSALDSVVSSAMYFTEQVLYLRNGKEAKTTWQLSQSFRDDRLPWQGEMVEATRAHTTSGNLARTFPKGHRLQMVLNYRYLQYTQEQFGDTEESLSGRADWQGQFFDRHIRHELTYALNNSRELRREFVFVQVPPGEGTHTWRDDNADGVQDLNEFYEAIHFDERNYIKIFVPTNEFIKAFDNQLNFRLNAEMPRKWRGITGWKGLLSRFSNTTSWNAQAKTTTDDLSGRMLAFATPASDLDMLSKRQAMRSTVFVNRANPGFGAEFNFMRTEQRQLLVNGFEGRQNEEGEMILRANLSKEHSVRWRIARAERQVFSDFLEGRNFGILQQRVSPEIAWQPSTRFRLTGRYVYTSRLQTDNLENPANSSLNEWIGEVRVARASKQNLQAQMRWVGIRFEGEVNSPLGYELLEALRPGTNLTWQVNFQHKLASGLQVNFNYEGRNSEGAGTVHIGRVQLTALF